MELRTKGDLLTWEIKRQEAEGLREGVCGETQTWEARRGSNVLSTFELQVLKLEVVERVESAGV